MYHNFPYLSQGFKSENVLIHSCKCVLFLCEHVCYFKVLSCRVGEHEVNEFQHVRLHVQLARLHEWTEIKFVVGQVPPLAFGGHDRGIQTLELNSRTNDFVLVGQNGNSDGGI